MSGKETWTATVQMAFDGTRTDVQCTVLDTTGSMCGDVAEDLMKSLTQSKTDVEVATKPHVLPQKEHHTKAVSHRGSCRFSYAEKKPAKKKAASKSKGEK